MAGEGLRCPAMETCDHCRRRTECWWIYTTKPWKLCRGCFTEHVGRAPGTPR